jgi:hypothetical protein
VTPVSDAVAVLVTVAVFVLLAVVAAGTERM